MGEQQQCVNGKHGKLSNVQEPCRTCLVDCLLYGKRMKWEPKEVSDADTSKTR